MSTKDFTKDQLHNSVSARLYAQELAEALTVFYWTQDLYHLDKAKSYLNELNKFDFDTMEKNNER